MHDMFDLHGKKAIVVGGAGDLGRSMLEAIAEAGAESVVIDRDENAEKLAADMRAKGLRVYAILADLRDRGQIESSFTEAVKVLGGRLDIILNAAGIQHRQKSEEFSLEAWDNILEINLTALFRYCQLAALQMIPSGGGKIINIASMLSFFGGFTVPAYAASKGGVAQLTKALANEWASKGINVNAIAPGYMATKLNTNIMNDPDRSTEILARIPQHRWGTGDDLKGITVFLAGSGSDYINGAIIPVDGGYLGR